MEEKQQSMDMTSANAEVLKLQKEKGELDLKLRQFKYASFCYLLIF